ncbi:MAG TPA: hypothetical protein VFW46_20030 [Stellaceae bacterium]|nr:hypothetical protein [Stellaceae bacterium]
MKTPRAKKAPPPADRGPVAPPALFSEGAIAAQGRVVVLEEGLYSLSLAPMPAQAEGSAGIRFPIVHVSAPPSEDYDMAEIVAGSGDVGGWCEAGGGVAVVKAPPGGGVVLVTTYGLAGAMAAIDVQRLGQPAAEAVRAEAALVASAPAPAPVAARAEGQIRSEIVLHIEREGDRRFEARGWVGNRGQRRRVEAFSIRPLETLAPGDVEYKAFGPNGRETPWVTDAKLCGTRGRGLPLTGFAVRLASHLRDRYDVVYEGAFFESGVAGPHRNGESCVPTVFDDPLEAINFRVLARP